MKKATTLIVSVIMAVVLLATLTGCIGQNEQKKFEGTWKAEFDLSKMFADKLEEADDMVKAYFDFSEVGGISVIYDFYSDGTYSKKPDKDSIDDFFENIEDIMKAGMVKAIEAGIKENDLDMSVDEFCAAAGVSVDQLVEKLMEDAGFEKEIKEMKNMSSEGKYRVNDGKVYLSKGLENNVDKNVYDTYKISGSKITLIQHYGPYEDGDDFTVVKYLYPIVLVKQ